MNTWRVRALAAFIVLVISYLITTDYTRPRPFSWIIGEWWRTETTIEIGGERIKAYVRDTPKSRAAGLSGWEGLADGEGMLFVFPGDGFHTFWMKDMRFPIDIVWISEGGEVVDIRGNVSPDTYPEYSFGPQEVARYVLELQAGWTTAHDVAIGAMVEF